jgi:Fe-S-cluster-containing hydrogenase component 2
VSDLYDPLHSLEKGNWFKLICGASFQDLPAIRSLALAYTLAGIDCIDLAADSAAIAAAKEGIAVAKTLMQEAMAGRTRTSLPLLMVSLNDGEDPHFRKAEFDSSLCPSDCPRPCEKICPANAIAFEEVGFAGVQDSRCYGCGRCLPVCPSNLIATRSYVFRQGAIAPLVKEMNVDAIEIHTQVGREQDFQRLWQEIEPWSQNLKVLAISCPDDLELIEYLFYLYELISPLPCVSIWQTDGRPMSGDIGRGTTRAAIELAQKVLKSHLPGHVQLAGGTNHHTVPKLKTMGLVREVGKQEKTKTPNSQSLKISGVAYGSYARTLLSPVLEQLDAAKLEECPQLLWQAVDRASSLVGQLKDGLEAPADNSSLLPAAKDFS